MPSARVVVFGYDELVFASVGVVGGSGCEVIGVVFPSKHRDGRVEQVRDQLAARGLPLFTQPPRRDVADFAEQMRSLRPDLFVVWSYPMVLPEALLAIPRLGCVNVHLGLLPGYRGANGVQQALIHGEAETGVTLHFMDAGLDTGPLIAQARFPIHADDDIVELLRRARAAGVMLLERALPALARGSVVGVPQDESHAHYHGRRSEADDRIDWSAPSVRTANLVRALVRPFPGAFTTWHGRKLVIRRVEPTPAPNEPTPPGTVYRVGPDELAVATGDGGLLVRELELEPGEKLDIHVGNRLGE